MANFERPVRVGIAGWSIPEAMRDHATAKLTLLQHYAAVFDVVEINSSFYRSHRMTTYHRWAASVPTGFRFAVKVPRTITHEYKLAHCEREVDAFMAQVRGLGDKLEVLLLQLPPSLTFDEHTARSFLQLLRQRCSARIVCEPRHPTWGGGAPDDIFNSLHITRATADPDPTGYSSRRPPDYAHNFAYFRLHGSPRIYYSSYSAADLAELKAALASSSTREVWCIFDNTAQGAAWNNACALMTRTPL